MTATSTAVIATKITSTSAQYATTPPAPPTWASSRKKYGYHPTSAPRTRVYGSHSEGYTSTQPTVDHGTRGFTAMMLSAVQATTASAGTTKCSSVSDHGTSMR